MDDEMAFDHAVSLFTAMGMAHCARSLDQAGLLDDWAKRSLRAHLDVLNEDAVRLRGHADLAWFDQLVQILPSLPPAS